MPRSRCRTTTVRAKQDGSPVTSADLAGNYILRAACLALFPAMPVVSEEDSRVFEAGKDSDSVLVIDPLDGTKEFIKGRDEFAVNIALVEDGHASAGLIYALARDRLSSPMAPDLHSSKQPAVSAAACPALPLHGVIRSRSSSALISIPGPKRFWPRCSPAILKKSAHR